MSDMLGLILFMCFVGFLAVGIVFIFICVLEAMQRNDK